MLGIYHADCLDGQAGAWVLTQAFGEDGIEFVPGVHGTAPPNVSGHSVILVDFSYKRPVLLEMAAQANSILILDHHQSAQAELVDLPANVIAIFDMERCGAALAWLHFFPDRRLPDLIAHIEDRDLWRFALPGTREITAAVDAYPFSLPGWNRLMREDPESLRKEGVPIVRRQDKDVRRQAETLAYRATFAGFDVPVINTLPGFASDVGHALCQGEPFAVCYWDTPEGRKYSLRSAPDGVDVAEIAARFGGGGHKHAAGFTVARKPVVHFEPDLRKRAVISPASSR